MFNAMVLSESVYKAADHRPDDAAHMAGLVAGDLPPLLVTLRVVQWCLPHVRQRYMLAESDDTLYCSLMGTKNIRQDLVCTCTWPSFYNV